MKKLPLMMGLLMLVLSMQAQETDRCMTMPVLKQQIQENPLVESRMEALERKVQDWITANAGQRDDTVYTIPVVVHVLWVDPVENISDNQVLSQIEVLNEDFRRVNADTANTRDEFKPIAADVGIQFCLATVDPDGNPTTGITRTEGNPTLFGFPTGSYSPLTNNIKFDSEGGKDAWPTDQYFNLWVGNLSLLGQPFVLGYAQFPQTMDDPANPEDPATDGVVIHYEVMGRQGNLIPDYDGGRSCTHEVGHWLGLRHIWGDGDCSMDDLVSDTPLAEDQSGGGCDTVNSCVDPGVDYVDMSENYMDYSRDACFNLFTEGQKTRMRAFLLNDAMRASLIANPKCDVNTSIKDELNAELAQSIELFPNPAHQSISLRRAPFTQPTAQLEILNVQGQSIKQLTSQEAETTISLDGIVPGIYFLKIETEEGIAIKKFVVE